jgi:hypothetical protein
MTGKRTGSERPISLGPSLARSRSRRMMPPWLRDLYRLQIRSSSTPCSDASTRHGAGRRSLSIAPSGRRWDLSALNHAPVPSTPLGTNIAASSKGQLFQASQLFSASDSDDDTLTYAVVDFTPDATSGHFTVNNQAITDSVMLLTAAQLAQTTFQAGLGGTDHLRVGVNDTPGATLNSPGWITQDFNVSAPVNASDFLFV